MRVKKRIISESDILFGHGHPINQSTPSNKKKMQCGHLPIDVISSSHSPHPAQPARMPQKATSCGSNAAHTMSANHQVWSDDSSATSGCVLEWPPPYDGDHSHPGSATQRQILRCPAAHGVDGSRSANEVLYLPPRSNEDVWGNVVLFPGDVQDLHHRM